MELNELIEELRLMDGAIAGMKRMLINKPALDATWKDLEKAQAAESQARAVVVDLKRKLEDAMTKDPDTARLAEMRVARNKCIAAIEKITGQPMREDGEFQKV
jgi:hypothetical protein